MTEKRRVVKKKLEELVASEEAVLPLAPEETELVSKPSLEQKLLKIYSEASKGTRWHQNNLAELTGATANEVCIAWHSLYDQGKLPLGFVKR